MKTYACLQCNTECVFGYSKVNKYCGVKCQKDFEYEAFIAAWKAGTVTVSNKGQVSRHIYRYIGEKFDYACTTCNNDTWLGKPIPLDLEHIDGNSDNNDESNLTILCCNCHSQTPTYKNRNKGKGRKSRLLATQETV